MAAATSGAVDTHFRRDIEGLRALAVLLVMAYHFGIPGISGGFIGVDVFFVISGFVITQLLSRKLVQGGFRFRDFYARRIRRLAPVLLVVTTATCLLVSPFYVMEEYYSFAKSWMASLVGMSNFFFLGELSQYFSPEAQSMPLLHTWSLGVEEQFYFIWPAALWAVNRFYRGSHAGRWFLLILVAALGLSVYMAHQHAMAAYYLLPARLFEFLLGTGVAVNAKRLPVPGRALAEILSLAGLALIVATALWLTSSDVFPGFNALWPTLGTALVIYTGLHRQDTLAARLLGLKPMVFLGGISYSMYLWHWPPVALLHYQLIEPDGWQIAGLFLLVTLLSWLSYRFVENRYRYRPWSLRKSFLILVLPAFLLVWGYQSAIRLHNDFSFRFLGGERGELFRAISQNKSTQLFKACFKSNPEHFNRAANCVVGAPLTAAGPDAVLIGDSHALSLVGFMEQLIREKGLSMLIVTQASNGFVATDGSRPFYDPDNEREIRNRALTAWLAQADSPRTVIVGAAWRSYLPKAESRERMVETLVWLAQRHQVIVLADAPALPNAAWAHCILVNRKDCSIAAADHLQEQQDFEQLRAAVDAQVKGVVWIDPVRVMCDDERCESVLDGVPLYSDESHLNQVGSKKMGREFLRRFGNPLEVLPAAAAVTAVAP